MSQKLQSFRKYLTKSKQIKQNWQRIENFCLSFDYYIQNLIRDDQSGSQPLSSRNTEIFLFSLSRNQYFRQLKLLCNASTKVTIIHIQSRFTCARKHSKLSQLHGKDGGISTNKAFWKSIKPLFTNKGFFKKMKILVA